MSNNDTIRHLFEKIKKAHDIYVKCSNEKQIAIMGVFDFVFKDLESMGVPRHLSESLLMFGKEFVESLPADPIIASPYGQMNSPEPINLPLSTLSTPNLPIEPSAPATIEDAERIFEAKSEPLTPKEQREFALAVKHGALVYRPLPTTGDTVKIEVLVKSSQGKLPIDK